MELKKDKRNEKTWDNYAYACFAMWQTEEDSSKKQEFQKELGTCIKRMKKYIPDTRVYYRYLLVQNSDSLEQERIHQQILSLKRTCERDFLDILVKTIQSRYGMEAVGKYKDTTDTENGQ